MESTLKAIIEQKLNAITDAIQIIQERTKQFNNVNEMLTDFYGTMVFDSCVMRLQTIGENIKSIDDRTEGSLLDKYPNIPWKQIIGLRNIISHEYANIDPDVIWSIIAKHLAPLAKDIDIIKNDLATL